MLKKVIGYLIVVLALGLPFHGVISVFLPDCFRFWKEAVLVILLGVVIYLELRTTLRFETKNPRSPLKKRGLIYSLLFLGWGSLLVFLSEDKQTAFVAFRYLGMGFLVYLIFSRLFTVYGEKWKEEVLQKFSRYFIWSCVASVLFGTWAKFLGGYEVLKQFYSTTISSWVPGQTLPLYHEAGGLIRMQGGSSGPIEFSHLLLVAIFLSLCWYPPQSSPFGKGGGCLSSPLRRGSWRGFWVQTGIVIILFFGIYQSYSRAALLALVVGGGIWLAVQRFFQKWKRGFIGLLLVFVIGGGVFLGIDSSFRNKLLERGGTSDHFTRPIEAFQMGLYRPFLGSLGALGPAARAKKLSENNDDQAPIAENVFVDYFAQLGLIGLVLAIGFFVSVFWKVQKQWWPFVGGFLVVTNLATIFDMTPVAIVFFIMLSFLQNTFQTPVSR